MWSAFALSLYAKAVRAVVTCSVVIEAQRSETEALLQRLRPHVVSKRNFVNGGCYKSVMLGRLPTVTVGFRTQSASRRARAPLTRAQALL